MTSSGSLRSAANSDLQGVFEILPVQIGLPTPARPTGDGMDDAGALLTWLDSCRRFKSPNTTRSYQKEAMRFRMWLEWAKADSSPRLLANVRADDIGPYLDYLHDPAPLPAQILHRYRRTTQPFDGPLMASSVRQAVVILASMYERFREIEDLKGQPYVQFNPFALVRGSVSSAARQAVGAPDELEQPKILPLEAWHLVQAYLERMVSNSPQDPLVHRNRWIVKLLYHSWLRRQEATSIKMGSFKNVNGKWRLSLIGKGAKRDEIVATSSLMTALREYREFFGLPPYPFPDEDRPAVMALRGSARDKKHVSAQTIYRVFKEILEAVATEIESENPSTAALLRAAGPHWMRHSGITHAADGGVDVKYTSKQARHSDIRTTIKNYYHPDDEAMRAQLEGVQDRPERKP